MNKIPALTFALTLGALSLPGIAMARQQAMTEPPVQSELTAQGYTNIHELKFKDGTWKAKAHNPSVEDDYIAKHYHQPSAEWQAS